MRFELTTPTLARLCSTTELRPLKTYAPAIKLSYPTARRPYGAEYLSNQAEK